MERFLDRWLRRQATHRVVASRYLQNEFKRRFGMNAAYIPYAAYLQPYPDGESPFSEPTAVYMGNLYPAYDHDIIFEAAMQLKAQNKTPRIKLLGHGPDLEKWRSFVQEHGMTNVEIAGFVRGEELWRNLRHAHVLLFPIRETLINLCRCPSKTFAYAQARRPVITNRVGEVAEVLGEKSTYIGFSPEAMAAALDQAMSASRAPDIDYEIQRQNWDERTDRLLGLIDGN
jgi:glycosyltransferase involved in cell wall biosynthesis